MRMAIIAPDDTVYIGSEARRSDCGTLRAEGIHAVQWQGEAGVGQGEIEYTDNRPNERFTHFSRFQGYIDNSRPLPTPDELNPRPEPPPPPSPPSETRPPPPPNMPDANARIEAAMAQLNTYLPTVPDVASRRLTEEQLQEYVSGLSKAIRAMLSGFSTAQPRQGESHVTARGVGAGGVATGDEHPDPEPPAAHEDSGSTARAKPATTTTRKPRHPSER